ncbi:hypothetical protein [Zavarzinia sp. CC-PAN008]
MEDETGPDLPIERSAAIGLEVWECPLVSRIPMAEAEAQFTQNTDGTFGS